MSTPRLLPALTVHQPWSWLIAEGVKPVENRTWPPPPNVNGHHLAIHAGRTVEENSYRAMAAELAGRPRPALWTGRTAPRLPAPQELVIGAIEAVVRVAGAIYTEGAAHGPHLRVLQILQPLEGPQLAQERAEELARDCYAFGPWLWVLEDAVRLRHPIPCRGAQKIWIVPDHQADLVRAGWRETRTKERSSST